MSGSPLWLWARRQYVVDRRSTRTSIARFLANDLLRRKHRLRHCLFSVVRMRNDHLVLNAPLSVSARRKDRDSQRCRVREGAILFIRLQSCAHPLQAVGKAFIVCS